MAYASRFYSHYDDVFEKVWPYFNFKPEQIACPITKELLIDHYSMGCLDRMADDVGAPLNILLGYASPTYLIEKKYPEDSPHTFGMAFLISKFYGPDLRREHELKELMYSAKEAGFVGFVIYPEAIRVDTVRPLFHDTTKPRE